MKLRKQFMALLVFVACALTTFAQQMPPIPMDPNVRVGKLENGLHSKRITNVVWLTSSSTCALTVQRNSPAMV